MDRHFLACLLLSLVTAPMSLGQKTPPSPSPSPGPTYPSPIPSSTLDHLDTFQQRLDRLVDEERKLTPEPPTKVVSLGEFEKTLADHRTSNDAKLASLLSGLSLGERADAETYSRWNTAFPGTKTRQAMMALADGSAFLPLSNEEIPAAPEPSAAEQHRMIEAVGSYLNNALPALPNFRATRRTEYFEDGPPRVLPLSTDPEPSDPLRNRPMHLVATTKRQVAYVDGHEVNERGSGYEDAAIEASRFSTAGEFGPILYGVMLDALQSTIVWARWERCEAGLLAVFRFNASKENSHFSLKPPSATAAKNQFVAYRGEIAVDPASGSILRLSVVALPGPDDAVETAQIAVEYGRIEIEQRFYLCPVHAVALSKVPLKSARLAKPGVTVPFQTQINDVEFAQYHVFRGDPHVVPQMTNP